MAHSWSTGGSALNASRAATTTSTTTATITALLAALVGALLALAAPAAAQEYTGDCSVTASYDLNAGVLTVTGSGLDPGTTTPVAVNGNEIGQATADGDGNFSGEFAVDLPDGTHTVSIFCDDDQIDGASTEVEVSEEVNVIHVIDPATINCNGILAGFAEPALPGSTVTFTIDQGNQLFASVTANAQGRAAYSGRVNLTPGNYSITSRGTDALGDPFAVTTNFTVRNNCTTGGTGTGGLPRTGSDTGPAVFAGLSAVVVGAGAVLVARRRRARAAIS